MFETTNNLQLVEERYAERRGGKAALSLDVRQYSSRTGHHVVKIKRSALIAVGRGDLRTCWSLYR